MIITTNSGQLVDTGSRGSGIPLLSDIALGLSRLPRFAGQTDRLYTVLDHSLAAHALAFNECVFEDHGQVDRRWGHQLQLLALLHDWHECLTGDIPKPIVDAIPEIGQLQAELDERFFASIGLTPDNMQRSIVAKIDRDLRMAEALVLHPAAFLKMNRDEGWNIDLVSVMEVVDVVNSFIALPMEQKTRIFMLNVQELRLDIEETQHVAPN